MEQRKTLQVYKKKIGNGNKISNKRSIQGQNRMNIFDYIFGGKKMKKSKLDKDLEKCREDFRFFSRRLFTHWAENNSEEFTTKLENLIIRWNMKMQEKAREKLDEKEEKYD